MDLYPLSLLVSLVMGFTRKYLLVNSVTGDVSKVCHQFIGSKWDTDKSSNHYGILVSSEGPLKKIRNKPHLIGLKAGISLAV